MVCGLARALFVPEGDGAATRFVVFPDKAACLVAVVIVFFAIAGVKNNRVAESVECDRAHPRPCVLVFHYVVRFLFQNEALGVSFFQKPRKYIILCLKDTRECLLKRTFDNNCLLSLQ